MTTENQSRLPFYGREAIHTDPELDLLSILDLSEAKDDISYNMGADLITHQTEIQRDSAVLNVWTACDWSDMDDFLCITAGSWIQRNSPTRHCGTCTALSYNKNNAGGERTLPSATRNSVATAIVGLYCAARLEFVRPKQGHFYVPKLSLLF
eukprot:SAG22_NODE_1317_length_4765_cov_2.131590_3_plen_152_part_00